MKEQGLITSTIILTLTSFFTRTLNMISIIFLSHLLGTEGMGLYHLIITVYMIAIVFASSGLSSSVSKLVAEELGQKHLRNAAHIMKIALTFSAFLSLLVGVSFFFFAPFIAKNFVQDTRAILSLRILSISIPFIACSSCFKGYFYATKKQVFQLVAKCLNKSLK
ncbi:MATE family efflux transporter [Cellulosilyticum ruminicola]|uniref:MATE family efflux transporter n=1 Tax=Cellulosilyticum ruminicola TaxID=425254 RepID=UPI00155DA3CA|nr:MATE family efflux transporter [Cellulosilyticum ruminicola]